MYARLYEKKKMSSIIKIDLRHNNEHESVW
jgi:hypothetical protein